MTSSFNIITCPQYTFEKLPVKRLAARLGVATSSPNFVAILSVFIILVDIWLFGLATIHSVWLAFCKKKTLIGVDVTK